MLLQRPFGEHAFRNDQPGHSAHPGLNKLRNQFLFMPFQIILRDTAQFARVQLFRAPHVSRQFRSLTTPLAEIFSLAKTEPFANHALNVLHP